MGEDTERFTKSVKSSVEVWLYGALSTFIGGGSSSAAAIVIDPQKFNIHEGLKNIASMFVASGLISLLFYLKQSPLPKLPTKESNEKSNQAVNPPIAGPAP